MKFEMSNISKKMIVIVDQGVFSGMSFLLNILLAHLLFPGDFGLFSSAVLVSYLLMSLTNSLVINPLQVNISDVENKDDYILFSFYFQFLLTLALLFILQIVFVLPSLDGYAYLKVPSILFCLAFVMHDYFRKIFLAIDHVLDCLIIDMLQLVAQLFLLFLLYSKNIHDLTDYMYGLSLAYLPGFIFSVFKIQFGRWQIISFKSHFIVHMKQGSWLLFTAVLQWTSSNFFTMISGVYVGLEALGALRVVQSLFGVLNVLLQTLENYALPIASKIGRESLERSKDYIRRISWQIGYLFGIVLLLLFVFSEKAMLIFGGEKFLDYNYLIKWMTFLYLLIYIGYPLRITIRITKQNQYIFMGYVLSFLFSISSFHFFLKQWNLTGAVIGLIINQSLVLIYWKYMLTVKKYNHGSHTHCTRESES